MSNMYDNSDLFIESDSWLGETVEFTLFGRKMTGVVKSKEDNHAGQNIMVQIEDGKKTVEVWGHFNCFRRIKK